MTYCLKFKSLATLSLVFSMLSFSLFVIAPEQSSSGFTHETTHDKVIPHTYCLSTVI